jgi:hypothetical protein
MNLECQKCGFVGMYRYINACTGEIGSKEDAVEYCPNDGFEMKPLKQETIH